jgi:hypothetical protein
VADQAQFGGTVGDTRPKSACSPSRHMRSGDSDWEPTSQAHIAMRALCGGMAIHWQPPGPPSESLAVSLGPGKIRLRVGESDSGVAHMGA